MSRFLQVILAIVGLVLTVVLQLASNRNAEVQNALGLVQLYTQEVAAAVEHCNLPMLQVAQDTALTLDRLREKGVLDTETDFNQHLLDVQATMNTPRCLAAAQTPVVVAPPQQQPQTADNAPATQAPAPAAETPIAPEFYARSQNLELRGIERQIEQAEQRAPGRANEPASEAAVAQQRYFAVLASYGVSDNATYDPLRGAAAHFNQLAAVTRAAGLQLEVYRTTASNHFALVLSAEGGAASAARDLVARARQEGWAPDAFAQVERDWVSCPAPITIDSLRQCAGEAISRDSESVLRRRN